MCNTYPLYVFCYSNEVDFIIMWAIIVYENMSPVYK